MKNKRHIFLTLVTLISAGLILLVLTDGLPLLRGPAPDTAVWHWNYKPRPLGRWWPALVAALLIFAASLWGQRTAQKTWTVWGTLVMLAAGSLLLQLSFFHADRGDALMEAIDRTLAVQTNGYFWTAAQLADLNGTLRDYPTLMTGFASDHARTKPPGLVLLNMLTIRLLERTPALSAGIAEVVRPLRCTDLWLYGQPDAVAAALGVWAFLPLVFAAATVFPAYFLARRLTGAETALWTAALAAALPALTIFAPLADQFYPFFILLILLLLSRGLETGGAGAFVLAGILLSFLTFLSVGNGTFLLVVGILALLTLWQTGELRQQPGKWVGRGAALALGGLSCWLIYWVGWGVPPWDVVQTGVDEHVALVVSKRAYTDWLLFNLVDLVIFTGFPLIAGFVAQSVTAVRELRGKRLIPVSVLSLATLFLLLFLNISGSTRGEVGRIWLFFMPLIGLVGAAYWTRGRRSRQYGLIFGLQLLTILSVGLSWGTVGATIGVAERPSSLPIPPTMTPRDVQFGDRITLHSDVVDMQAERIDVTLLWESDGPAARPYTVFLHLVDAENNIAAQVDRWPGQGAWPPTCWQRGEQLVDVYEIALTDALPAGTYTLFVGLYDAATAERVLSGTGADALPLQELVITDQP